MKKLIPLILLMIVSCSHKKEVKQVVEISCGKCQFGLDTKDGCHLAVRFDDKAYFVDGFNIDDFGDAHDKHTGFCEVIRKAEITGFIEDGEYKASAINLID